jgi:flagellar M-ring protein FliF
MPALLANVTPRGRIVLALCVVAVIALLFLGMQIAGRPSYALVSTGLDPADTGKVAAALDEQGIKYELRNNGTALAVEKAQTAQARIALAGKGLGGGSGAQPGFELFDKQKIGTSDFQQQVTYQRALEGQISKTIDQVQGVNGVQVRLVLADDQLFSESATPATAAVLLTGASSGLEPGAIRGIAQLVSSSVKGLKTSNVSITDGGGELLWPRGEGATGGGASKQTVEARYEAQVEAGLAALLTRTVGPGKAEVQVSADVNADEATKDELKYGKSTPLKETVESEKLASGSTAPGASGTTANIPSLTQTTSGAGGGDGYDRKSSTKQYGVDKTVIRTKVAPGAVNKLNVALIVDKTVPAAEIPALQKAVSSAAGIDLGRGDTIAVSQIAFAKAAKATAPSAGPAGGMIGYAKYGAAGVGLLGFLIFSARQLRRREGEMLMREPNWLREIEAPTSLASLERPRLASALPERAPDPAREQVEELAAREPERVAQQIRTWMRDS